MLNIQRLSSFAFVLGMLIAGTEKVFMYAGAQCTDIEFLFFMIEQADAGD